MHMSTYIPTDEEKEGLKLVVAMMTTYLNGEQVTPLLKDVSYETLKAALIFSVMHGTAIYRLYVESKGKNPVEAVQILGMAVAKEIL